MRAWTVRIRRAFRSVHAVNDAIGSSRGNERTRREDRWETLAQAFAAHHFPSENLPLVQRLVDAVGVDHYEAIESRTYIKGIRRGPGPTLHIAFGYTGGLASEAEILDAVGDVDRASGENSREWWIHHPVNRLRDGSGTTDRSASRDYGTCPACYTALPASGACGCGA